MADATDWLGLTGKVCAIAGAGGGIGKRDGSAGFGGAGGRAGEQRGAAATERLACGS